MGTTSTNVKHESVLADGYRVMSGAADQVSKPQHLTLKHGPYLINVCFSHLVD